MVVEGLQMQTPSASNLLGSRYPTAFKRMKRALLGPTDHWSNCRSAPHNFRLLIRHLTALELGTKKSRVGLSQGVGGLCAGFVRRICRVRSSVQDFRERSRTY